MERRNAWLSYGENEEKRDGADCKKLQKAFWMQEKQEENV